MLATTPKSSASSSTPRLAEDLAALFETRTIEHVLKTTTTKCNLGHFLVKEREREEMKTNAFLILEDFYLACVCVDLLFLIMLSWIT